MVAGSLKRALVTPRLKSRLLHSIWISVQDLGDGYEVRLVLWMDINISMSKLWYKTHHKCIKNNVIYIFLTMVNGNKIKPTKKRSYNTTPHNTFFTKVMCIMLIRVSTLNVYTDGWTPRDLTQRISHERFWSSVWVAWLPSWLCWLPLTYD